MAIPMAGFRYKHWFDQCSGGIAACGNGQFDAILLADFLSKRGPAGGLATTYQMEDRFGLGDAKGLTIG